MKKLVLFLLPPLLACVVFFSAMYILSKTDKGKGALQITSTPKADVYLDGKLIGTTPFCKCKLPEMISTGDYTVKLVPKDLPAGRQGSNLQPFEQQIPINKSVITVVDVAFGDNNNNSARIISLAPLTDTNSTQIFATSFPDNAKVLLDKNDSGNTPVLLKDVTDSDHDILFDKDGYESKLLHVHTVKGYKLSAIAFLAVKSDLTATTSAGPALPVASVSGSPSISPTPSLTGKPSGTPSPTPKTSVTPNITITPTHSAGSGSPTPAGATATGSQVLILNTPTGFLHVRSTPSSGGTIITNVDPGQTFLLITQQSGWYQIQLTDGTKGWVSGQYAKVQ
ncbi:MAG TPA: PEGA domain-containing protein [Candidatus Saccharimonadales bacterium]|nr:PEGA domain-containing protein [Candidatus Saccharimonadales bacterium]